jgi:hypothetical protein
MRPKAENEERDRYSRRYAAVLATEAMIEFRSKRGETVLTIEAEDNALWDDMVQVTAKGVQHRHQVKRQQTALGEAEFAEYVKAAATGAPDVHYHFAFPVLIDVEKAGELRVLRTLCGRVQQEGAQQDKAFANLREAERRWVNALVKWSGRKEENIFTLLQRIHIDIIGYEEDLNRRAVRLLEPIFSHRTEDAWAAALQFVSDKDGVVAIHPSQVLGVMPQPAADDVETFYLSFVEDVESCFLLHRWPALTDHLVRDLMPLAFNERGYSFVHSVIGAAWPDRYPDLNSSFQQLASRLHDYLAHFDTRSRTQGNWVRQDKSYKAIFPNPRYAEESAAARAWEKENFRLLWNVVVALNKLFEAVRKHLKPTYRLRDGKLGIHDQMGVTNQLNSTVYYPDGYY